LSDSGIGREMHVIVGQGQLDAILLANPEERRAFIEEAAGVLKHRKRKEKALRKLDSMQANLARIQDLTVELRRQLKPLGKQAEVARRASTIQSDVRDAKLRLLADDLISLRQSFDAEVADETSLRARRDQVESALAESRAREEQLDSTALIENPQLVQAQENFYRLTAQREKFRGIQSLASERARFLSEERDEARANGRDPESMDAEAIALREEEASLRGQGQSARASLNKITEALRATEAELRAEESQVSAAQRAIADAREGTARQEGHINGLRARIDATNAEITRLTTARLEAESRLHGFRTDFASLEAEIAGVDRFEPELDADYEKALAELNKVNAKHAALLESEQGASRERAGLTARLVALEESLLHRDGGEAILKGRGGATSRGRLSSLISVTSGWEAAVAAALGPLAESIVVSDLAAAVHALSMLKSESAGQSELLVVDGEFSSQNEIPSGFSSLASLIKSDGLEAMIDALLGGVVAVDDIAAAERVISQNPRLMAVTRDGDLISRNRVRGGSAGSNSAIEISALIEKTRSALDEIISRCDSLKFELASSTASVEVAQKAHDTALAGLNESDAKMSGLAEQMAVAGQNVKSSQAEVERLNASLAAASEQRSSDERDLEVAIAQFDSHQTPPEPDLKTLEEIRERVTAARAVEVEARLELRTMEERITAVADRARNLEQSAQAERDNAVKAIARMHERSIAATKAREIADLAYEALIQLEVTLAKALTERERLEASRTDREGETLNVRGKIRELTAELDQLTSSVHRDEILRAEQRLRLEALEVRSVEEMGVDVETLVTEYGPDKDVPTLVEDEEGNFVPGDLIPYRRDQQEKRLAQAERGLAMLGKINPLALEEYTAHEERLKYLAEQLEDLKKTKKDLLDIIKEVDEKVVQIFSDAYHDTAREFEAIFGRLFPGGDGRLILTDPNNMMTTGVDVEARPPGKRVKRLSLLSGGERSLVAVAMLVAIFKARPSPFYVMDEVEAALDDTNLSRLLGVFEELREKSQLIIITHQKRTMEIADALYGVTMRGDGVSEVISQRLRESESV
jgi:chromosome segregation protein